MSRAHSIVFIWLTVATTSACTIGNPPTSPTIIPGASVASASTSAPNVWDSREELAAWAQNGAGSGSIGLVGDGPNAVIRIDVSAGTAILHGPDLDPQDRRVSLAYVRYRWVGRVDGEGILVTMYLRPVEFDARLHVPRLFYLPRDLSKPPEYETGDWVEQDFTDHNVNSSRPPYEVLFATLQVRSLYTWKPPIHGFVEIDRIALVR